MQALKRFSNVTEGTYLDPPCAESKFFDIVFFSLFAVFVFLIL